MKPVFVYSTIPLLTVGVASSSTYSIASTCKGVDTGPTHGVDTGPTDNDSSDTIVGTLFL